VIFHQWHVDWSVRCETPAGSACQLPEYSSRKACDEEARFDVVFLADAGAQILP
jgi:hypothetical protein